MKRIQYLCLIFALLLTVMPLAGCGGEQDTPPEDTTGAATNADPVGTEADPADTEPEDTSIRIALMKDGASAFRFIINPQAKTTVKTAVNILRNTLTNLTDVYAVISPDQNEAKQPVTYPGAAFVVGHTNRPDEIAFRAELAAKSEYAFGIRAEADTVIVTATHEDLIPVALEYFTSRYLTVGENGALSVERGTTVTLALEEPSVIVTGTKGSAAKIETDRHYATVAERVGTIPKSGNFKILQGGCATADYAWFAMINTADYDTNAAGVWIYKLDAKTWKVIKKSDLLMLDHANDITYNPKTNEIIVAHCYVDNKKATCIDADKLTITRVLRSTDKGFYSITYNPDKDEFVCGTGKANMNKFNGTLSVFKAYYAGSGTQLVTQGICSTNDYIYHVLFTSSTPGEPYNMIFVNRYDNGKKVNNIILSIAGQEPENISVVGDSFIIGCNSSSTTTADVYRVDLIDFGTF